MIEKKKQVFVIRWLSQSAGKRKKNIFCLVLLQAFLGIGSVLSALLFRNLVDQAASGNKQGFFQALIFVAVLMISQIFLNALRYFLCEWGRSALENQLKEKLFSCLLRKSYGAVTRIHSGEWMNRLTSDTVVVANGLMDIIPGLTGLMIRLMGALAVIFVLQPVFILILIPGGCLFFLFAGGFRKVLKRQHKQIQEADGALRVFLQERLENLMIVRTFAMEKDTEEKAVEKMRRHKTARIHRNLLSDMCNTAFGLAANGIYLFGAAYCGYGILNGTLSYGTMTAVLQLISQIQMPFTNLTGYLPKYYAVIASAERLIEAEQYEEDLKDHLVDSAEVRRFYQKEMNAIGLRNATFAYQSVQQNGSENRGEPVRYAKSGSCDLNEAVQQNISGKAILNRINLEIRKGECVAVTGHSGCGKSTVLKLLMSLYPLESGEGYMIYTEDNGSMASRSIEKKKCLTARWRGMFAYVPQGNQLMSGTIREIVAFGDPEKMRQDRLLNRALQVACADKFVNALNMGLDTRLGEKGSGLSEGQMQRIAIARAVFADRPILMLDESTSALDEETERRLLANLKAMTDKTVLIVTHRPVVLEICDKQVLMTEEGIEVRNRKI